VHGLSLVIDDYEEALGARRNENDRVHGAQPGDPDEAVSAFVTVIESDDPPRLLLLGDNASTAYRTISAQLGGPERNQGVRRVVVRGAPQDSRARGSTRWRLPHRTGGRLAEAAASRARAAQSTELESPSRVARSSGAISKSNSPLDRIRSGVTDFGSTRMSCSMR
jgi:hypothetical protein